MWSTEETSLYQEEPEETTLATTLWTVGTALTPLPQSSKTQWKSIQRGRSRGTERRDVILTCACDQMAFSIMSSDGRPGPVLFWAGCVCTIHTHTHTCTHVHTLADTHTHRRTHSLGYSLRHSYMHTVYICTHIYIHSCSQINTYIYKHSHVHTPSLTHTYAHTQI